MSYRKNVDAPVWSKSHFVTWLLSKDPRTTYSYSDNCGCLLSAYISEATGRGIFMGSATYSFADDPQVSFPVPEAFDEVAMGRKNWAYGGVGQRTYGAALERALAWLD